jgi:Uma2 family endonuclease
LVLALERFVAERGLGRVFTAPCDVVFSEHDVLQPDIFFIAEERRHIITEKNIWGAPDLVVEVVSPSTEERDRIAKLGVYARYGVKEYWLVELEDRKVKVLRLGEGGYETAGIYGEEDFLESPLLEGLKVNLKGIFERL